MAHPNYFFIYTSKKKNIKETKWDYSSQGPS